jgi:hypothetical protein
MTDEDEIAELRSQIEKALARIEQLEEEISDQLRLNRLNDFLARHGRKAYFMFGPFGLDEAASKLERDSNWPWRDVNRRCGFCGCFLFPAKEMERIPTMNTNEVDYEHSSREQLMAAAREEGFDSDIRERIAAEPERYSTYFYVRGRKVPFGDYTVLYFHAPCFESILEGDADLLEAHAAFLGNE